MTTVSVLCDIACHLGEGPTYDPASNTLFWFDIREKKLLEKRMPDGDVTVHDLPFMASALAVIDDRRQLIVGETGLHVRDVETGALTLHTPVEADNARTRSNDSRVHPCGALWFGTMSKTEEKGAGAIYWYFRGEVRTLYPGIGIPNSICFSGDGRIAYFTDTAVNLLMRVACDPSTGLPMGEPAVFHDQRRDIGGIDGSVVDAEGVLWNARWGAGSLDAYSPDGKRIRSVAIPARQSSCPAFVGPTADRIAVTSAWQGYDDAARRRDPEAGKTFLVELPVKGRFDPPVAL
ncbi:SMP-30/gluconolactonase/LRE family protein [Mesorhizobium sp. ZMM04-5]|uniref:SMP-30/gluconolactonase/LRE family protein n=1 Tax=Mesorhizobium marinum TaxID=3228790 RepID=A0ABV3QZY8_9HYPH